MIATNCYILLLFLCWASSVTSRRKWTEGDIRLVGGRRRYMGTVVIYHNGHWGAVCDDHWGMNDASVACRQLGYTYAVRATTRSEFGHGRRRMWLTQARCRGTEKRLEQCTFRGYDRFTRHYCPGQFRSAGVICSAAVPSAMRMPKRNLKTTPKPEKPSTTTTPTTTSSTTTPTTTESTTTTTTTTTTTPTTTTTTTTPTTTTTTTTATTTTTMPTTTSPSTTSTFTTTATAPQESSDKRSNTSSSASGNKAINITSEDFEEPQNSSSLYDVMKSDGVYHVREEAIPLPAMSVLKDETKAKEKYPADAPLNENLEIQLKGGRYKWEGHLQVRINEGQWGSICSDHWTIREAMVACNQLKDIGKAKQALLTTYFGGKDLPKLLYSVKCVGREQSLSKCNITKIDDNHSCSKTSAVAGIVCSDHLPDLVPNLQAVELSVRLQDQPLYYLRCAMEENCLASSAYVIRNTSRVWRNSMRRLLRFSTVVHNRGLADFKPYLPRGQWEWHSCHMHYHSMEVFAHYDILDSNGTRLAEGSKASFCLEDTTCDQGVQPKFNCRGFSEQGLSVNCSDNYMYDIDCQWIDISDIKPGDYTFLMEVNPTFLVAEESFDNNVVSCHLNYNGYFASLKRCHYESLLDHRLPMKLEG